MSLQLSRMTPCFPGMFIHTKNEVRFTRTNTLVHTTAHQPNKRPQTQIQSQTTTSKRLKGATDITC